MAWAASRTRALNSGESIFTSFGSSGLGGSFFGSSLAVLLSFGFGGGCDGDFGGPGTEVVGYGCVGHGRFYLRTLPAFRRRTACLARGRRAGRQQERFELLGHRDGHRLAVEQLGQFPHDRGDVVRLGGVDAVAHVVLGLRGRRRGARGYWTGRLRRDRLERESVGRARAVVAPGTQRHLLREVVPRQERGAVEPVGAGAPALHVRRREQPLPHLGQRIDHVGQRDAPGHRGVDRAQRALDRPLHPLAVRVLAEEHP